MQYIYMYQLLFSRKKKTSFSFAFRALNCTFETIVSKILTFGFSQINLENRSLNRIFASQIQ